MIRKLCLLGMFAIATFTAKSQLIQDLYKAYDPAYGSQIAADTAAVFTPFGIIKPGVNYGLSLGTGYSFMGGNRGVSGSYISPSMSYSVDGKLAVMGGVTLSRTSFSGFNTSSVTNSNVEPNSGNPYSAWAYAQYSINKRLNVFAMGSVSNNQQYYSPWSNSFGTASFQNVGVGFNYKLTNKTTIGASFNFINQNGLSPFYTTSPFQTFPY
ncbi:MAG: hypothetical protein H6537_11820 [Bacteroidales bacterium]|nr:hypothetical protein [Bacteroidales bacterium]HRX32447.1 hypothetical protein [Tenuifilaceae bacterium]